MSGQALDGRSGETRPEKFTGSTGFISTHSKGPVLRKILDVRVSNSHRARIFPNSEKCTRKVFVPPLA